MALPEKISEKLKLVDSKKNKLGKVILKLAMEWKDLDEQLDSTEKCVEGSFNELRFRENNLDSIHESLRESNEGLESVRKSIESRVEELERREKKFLSFQQTQDAELRLKQKQLDTMLRSAEEQIKDAEVRGERVTEQHKLLERLLEKLELEKEQLEHIQRSIDQRFEEIILKESYFEGRSRELDSMQHWIERRAKELDTKEEQVYDRAKELDTIEELIDDRVNELELQEELNRMWNEERCKELESIEGKISSAQKLNEERCMELELKEEKISSAQKLNEEWSEKLDSKEKQLDAVQKYINQSFKDFHSQNKQLKADKKLFEERSKELESKEKQLEQLAEGVELKLKQLDTRVHSRVKMEQLEDVMPVDKANIQFVVTMDGRSLQLFLNERSHSDESMASEVYRVLQLSMDPGKLVLDAMEGFYPPHLKKGDEEFEEDVPKRSCILLLEQLMKISPQITSSVKEEASKLAGKWKEKMRVVPGNYLEVLGFLQLLASYKLASCFDNDELLQLFAVVAEHNQAHDLCRVLGFTEKVPDLIENLVKEKQELVAVRLSFSFGICDKFPPVPLLKSYLRRAKKVAKKQSILGKKSIEGQGTVIEESVASIRDVIKFFVDHNLESHFACKYLEQGIKHLLTRKQSNKRIRACLIKARAPEYKVNEASSSSTATVHPKASASKLDPTTRTMACILAHMDGKNLQLFLNEHLAEHERIHKEVYDALQTSSDLGKLVLDAMQGFYPPHSEKGGVDIEASVIRRSCIFLLEILMRLSQKIKPQVKEAAMKLAVAWKAKAIVESKNSVAILGFLLLVGTYGLAPAFNTDELGYLFQTIAEHRLAPQISQLLCFSEKIPVNNNVCFQEKIDQSASENLQLNSIVPFSSVGHSHSMWCEDLAFIQSASDPTKLVLDLMIGCYHSNFNLITIRAFTVLLSELLRVPVEVKTHVKDEAMKLASDWKDRVNQQRSSEAWCFLLFLATYKGASCFHTNELLGLLENFGDRRQATDLFGALGLADEASNFIGCLIHRALYLEAIKFIYAFGLPDKFLPTSLLKRYLSLAKEDADNTRKEGRKEGRKSHMFFRAQDKATKKEVTALNRVISCIKMHGLESQFSPAKLEARIGQLLRQQRSVAPAPAANGQPPKDVKKRSDMQSLASMARQQDQNGRKRFASVLEHDFNTQPHEHSGKKICRELHSAEANDHVSTAHSIQSIPHPYQHPPGVFTAETAPYPTTHSAHYSLGPSTPVPAMHTSHVRPNYGSGTAANGGFPPFSLVGTQYGSVFNSNPNPYTVAGKPYYSLSDPKKAGSW